MEHDDNVSDTAARTGVATNKVEAVVALLLLVAGLVVVFESRRLGAGWTSDGPGAGYFPFFIGLIITISGIGILYQSLLGLYVASAVYIALFMVILGKYSWVKAALAALAVNTLFFFMFEVWFKVPLFKGALDPLSFLGY